MIMRNSSSVRFAALAFTVVVAAAAAGPTHPLMEMDPTK
jgi:hypothetical protein